LYLCRHSFNPFAFGTSATLRIMKSDHGFALLFLKPRAAADYSKRKIALAGDVYKANVMQPRQTDYFRLSVATDLRTTKGVPVCSAN
jgi:hypothetical protein